MRSHPPIPPIASLGGDVPQPGLPNEALRGGDTLESPDSPGVAKKVHQSHQITHIHQYLRPPAPDRRCKIPFERYKPVYKPCDYIYLGDHYNGLQGPPHAKACYQAKALSSHQAESASPKHRADRETLWRTRWQRPSKL